MKRLFAGLAIVVLTGCAAMMFPPTPHDFKRHETFGASYEKVWQAVLDIFSENGWPVEKQEKEAGILVSESVADNLNAGDYGEGPHLKPNSGRMVVNVQAIKVSEDSTRVRVHGFFQVKWIVDNRDQWAMGTSRGVIEKRILDMLHSRL